MGLQRWYVPNSLVLSVFDLYWKERKLIQIDIELSHPARISNAIVSPHGCSRVTFGCIYSYCNISFLAINTLIWNVANKFSHLERPRNKWLCFNLQYIAMRRHENTGIWAKPKTSSDVLGGLSYVLRMLPIPKWPPWSESFKVVFADYLGQQQCNVLGVLGENCWLLYPPPAADCWLL